ncbi:bifunctional diaminohydroxyphosphoribosylaminopyrimidine deaminase/5-amino-6-(5-phosphoribosylamino)uracil reductase RibD [Helicobacter pametensis]|uniref:bifunctional diaminohydroxyphosphoribosylaminopyrimidine deaminase/5-amino-6-(5-phosphoribosylamino)uracil reductase RibD n=1 Tax=Helicobacter pametensis TaxID=95149 RepID=UPI0004ACEB91|nr:bifunctional diaminohydroxyphosphoribosylaminopyrimidine deaminase/5-amino-6-(5-phosphoribosylamino)uracil reductase RibD [Helicobacter pametensis]
MVTTEEIFLLQAIAKAWETQTFALPNPSVGALILSEDFQVLALKSHVRFGSSHAELLALKQAFLRLSPQEPQVNLDSLSPKELWEFLALHHGGIFEGCSIFVTLEPCLHEGKTPSCAKLLAILKPKRVIFGSYDLTDQAQGGAQFLSSCGIEVIGGICLEESLNLLYPFLTYLKKGRFNLFKLAQRLNGDYKRGQISNMDSKIFTHTQRSNADLIVVSGNTVRCDHPRLDTRFSRWQNKTPRIEILTKHSAPLDSICAKEIRVCYDKEELSLERGFNLIEGGYPLLKALQERIDCFLLIVAPVLEGMATDVSSKIEFDLLYLCQFGLKQKDVALWFKPKDHL